MIQGTPKIRQRPTAAAVHVGSFQEVANARPNPPRGEGVSLGNQDALLLSDILLSGTPQTAPVQGFLKSRLTRIYDNPKEGELFDDDCADFMIATIEGRQDDYGRSQDALFEATRQGLEAALFNDHGTPEKHPNVADAERLGFSDEELLTVIGIGMRRHIDCLPVDTIANKLAAGAISVEGARRAALAASRNPDGTVATNAGRAASSLSQTEQANVRPMVPYMTLNQIGSDTIISVSGTRLDRTVNGNGETTSVILPINRNVAVETLLAANDTYTVRHTRNGLVMRELTGVDYEDLGQVVVDAADPQSGFGS